jgi:hypothetical protein
MADQPPPPQPSSPQEIEALIRKIDPKTFDRLPRPALRTHSFVGPNWKCTVPVPHRASNCRKHFRRGDAGGCSRRLHNRQTTTSAGSIREENSGQTKGKILKISPGTLLDCRAIDLYKASRPDSWPLVAGRKDWYLRRTPHARGSGATHASQCFASTPRAVNPVTVAPESRRSAEVGSSFIRAIE